MRNDILSASEAGSHRGFSTCSDTPKEIMERSSEIFSVKMTQMMHGDVGASKEISEAAGMITPTYDTLREIAEEIEDEEAPTQRSWHCPGKEFMEITAVEKLWALHKVGNEKIYLYLAGVLPPPRPPG